MSESQDIHGKYSPEDIRKALQVILDTPTLLERLIQEKEKVHKRKANWSKLSNEPYYTKRYGLEFKSVIDDMIQTGKNKEYRYDDYPDKSHRTLYAQLNQAKNYLLDELDPDLYYKEMLQKIKITNETTGVRLTHLRGVCSLVPIDIGLNGTIQSWKVKMDDYLKTAKFGDKPLKITNISLSEDEVNMIKESFISMEKIACYVTPTEIHIGIIAE